MIGFGNGCVARVVLLFAIRIGSGCCAVGLYGDCLLFSVALIVVCYGVIVRMLLVNSVVYLRVMVCVT